MIHGKVIKVEETEGDMFITVQVVPYRLTGPNEDETKRQYRLRITQQAANWEEYNNMHLGDIMLEQEINQADIDQIIKERFGK